ncbi:hypothetical protein DXG03_002830 [Asterophora parasitica]|uniref:F-box domain-containing protein n=1 Tax=Asterophora parasitica TaxID=117018 RepID=A0A9P7G2G9_9AGAR|nr:hypothetical protein DXG03_002830 [Asterophora parasitica]
MERRSLRPHKAPAKEHAADTDEDDGAQDGRDPDAPPPKKVIRRTPTVKNTQSKASSKTERIRGKRGKLESMNDMPFDILCEIFAHLSLVDILHLSRTSKALRNFLMHRSASHIWKNARSQIDGLPDCPNDLSEPHYANLIYSPTCHYQDEMAALGTLAQEEEWRISKETEFMARIEHVIKCSWGEEVALHEARSSKRSWCRLSALSEHKLVKQPRELTDQIWGNIKAAVIEFMENVKAERLEWEYMATVNNRGKVLLEVLKNYASSLPLDSVLPPLADVADLPSFRSIIEDTPIEEDVLEAHFDEPMLSFPEIVETWRTSKDAELVAMLKAGDEIEAEV